MAESLNPYPCATQRKSRLQEIRERYQADVQRESDQEMARKIREDCLSTEDDSLFAELRQRVEQERTKVEAYGARMSTHNFVYATLMHLANLLDEAHSA